MTISPWQRLVAAVATGASFTWSALLLNEGAPSSKALIVGAIFLLIALIPPVSGERLWPEPSNWMKEAAVRVRTRRRYYFTGAAVLLLALSAVAAYYWRSAKSQALAAQVIADENHVAFARARAKRRAEINERYCDCLASASLKQSGSTGMSAQLAANGILDVEKCKYERLNPGGWGSASNAADPVMQKMVEDRDQALAFDLAASPPPKCNK